MDESMVWYGSLSRPATRGVSEVNRQSPGWRSRHIQLDRYFVQATVLPALLVMVCVFGLPLTFSLYLSFTGWAPDQALFTGRFVGLANYQDLLTDPAFTGALGKTFGYTAAAVAAQMGLGLAI